MLFNSFEFLLFFLIVTAAYFLLPHKLRWFHLLIASCYFYMCFVPIYILILFFTIIIDYIAGIVIQNATGKKRKLMLVVSIAANVGVLCFFKYYNFFAINWNSFFHFTNGNASIPLLNIILPIGLSFHTFQAMSYTIEIYRGNQHAERHFGIYALYVMFYPQLVAGPIERPQNIIHQFHEKKHFDYPKFASGLRLMLWGLIKKVVIADRLATLVDPIYNNAGESSGVSLILASFFFLLQIYCDFSGYSDIAVGAARVMGFELMINFNRPFISKNVSEFWKRWHRSLSTWFYDYVFNPFVGTVRHWRKGAIAIGLFLTFFLSGLWHGASWTFVLWGVVHGFALIYEFLTKGIRERIFAKVPNWLNSSISWFATFSFLVLTAVLFRAKNIRQALIIYRKMCAIPHELMLVFAKKKLTFLHLPALAYIFGALLLIILLQIAESLQEKYDLKENFSRFPIYVRLGTYYAAVFLIFYFGVFDKHEFIYFQF